MNTRELDSYAIGDTKYGNVDDNLDLEALR
jgi:hypothetical protein